MLQAEVFDVDVEVAELADHAQWFMDYRNADGSLAEMCGNGVRVFARYLVEAGYANPGEFPVGTRAGNRPVVTHPGGEVTVDMGPVAVFAESTAELGGRSHPGVAVDVGTGSGAIALALACEGRFERVVATDVSTDALDVARANAAHARRAMCAPVEFRHGALLAPLRDPAAPVEELRRKVLEGK